MSDTEKFIPGLYFNLPRDGAPDFVLGGIKIDLPRFIEWAKSQPDTEVRADLKRSKDGKGYAERNTWKPKGDGARPISKAQSDKAYQAAEDDGDGIPF
jgi:hypothetical protein